jgi:uncharacterized protein Smg (DUF494 family)
VKERIVELLVHIMSQGHGKLELNEIDLGEMKNRGYTQSEITEALSWLYENMQVDNGVVRIPTHSPEGSRRILHDVEKSALSLDGQGYLIQLRELGLLDDRDLETVIERAVLTGYENLSVDEIREIAASVLFGKEGRSSRPLLNSRETIH